MKRIKVIVAALLITVGLVAFVAFVSKSTHKSGDIVTYCFTGSHKFIGCGNPNSLVESEVKNEINWPSLGECICSTGNYLCAVTFDLDELTKQEAINRLWIYYISNNCTLPAHGGSFTISIGGDNYIITIYRKPTN